MAQATRSAVRSPDSRRIAVARASDLAAGRDRCATETESPSGPQEHTIESATQIVRRLNQRASNLADLLRDANTRLFGPQPEPGADGNANAPSLCDVAQLFDSLTALEGSIDALASEIGRIVQV